MVSVYDITNKILSCDSDYIVDVIMRPKFGYWHFCMSEVIITSILQGFGQKNHYFEEWSCFKLLILGWH